MLDMYPFLSVGPAAVFYALVWSVAVLLIISNHIHDAINDLDA